MSKRLIVNADGFGFTYGNNLGILECLPAGVVRSVSVNANFPAVEEVSRLREFPGVSVGIHLNLTVGHCVSDPSDIPDLVDQNGEFLGRRFRSKAGRGKIPHQQMVGELTAQIDRLRNLGVRLSHWDSHQNQHLYPPFFRAAIEVASTMGISRMRTHDQYLFTARGLRPMRVALHLLTHPKRALTYAYAARLMRVARARGMRMADGLISPGRLDSMRKFHREFWSAVFRLLPEGVWELYCHPGYPDQTLASHAEYVNERIEELKILRDPALAEEVRQYGVELISFNDI